MMILVINDMKTNFVQRYAGKEIFIGNLERTLIRLPTNNGNIELCVRHIHYSTRISELSDIDHIIISCEKLAFTDINLICTRIRGVNKHIIITLACGNIDIKENTVSSAFYKYNPIILWCNERRWYHIISIIQNRYVYCPII